MGTDPQFHTFLGQPILDRCPYCKLPVQPGETHGEIVPTARTYDPVTEQIGPKVVCRIKKLVYVENVIETPAPDPA